MATDVKVPDIGDFEDVPVIEVLVSPGDTVEADDGLVTLESEKATMDVPAPEAGTITEILVSEGDKVSEGTVIAKMEAGDGDDDEGDAADADADADGDDAEGGDGDDADGGDGEDEDSGDDEGGGAAEADASEV